MTPLDLEREFGLSEGNIFQGELSLEQLFFLRPVPGGRSIDTDQESLHVRIRHASWRRHHGRERASGRSRNSERREGSGLAMPETRDVVIIGGGHNGLVTAFYLAKAGLSRWCSNAARRLAAQPSPKNFIRDFAAPRLRTTRAAACRCRARHAAGKTWAEIDNAGSRRTSLSPDGRALILYNDRREPSRRLRKFSQKDAEAIWISSSRSARSAK